MRKVLKVPASLAVMVVAAGCAPAVESPDVTQRDATSPSVDVAETPRVDGGCYSGSLYLGQNRRCFPEYPATSCRVERACRTSECGEGCATCSELFQCFPEIIPRTDDAQVVADAALPRCDSPRFTCSRFGCEPGCQTFPAPVEGGGGVG